MNAEDKNKQQKTTTLTTATTSQSLEKDYRDTPVSIPEVDEDELLASDLESISSASTTVFLGSCGHSTPERPSTSKGVVSSKGATAKPKKKIKKSSGCVMKEKHRRALFILERIKKNREAGVVHPKDAEDEKRCLAILEEYKEYSMKQENRKKIEATKRDRSKDGPTSEPKRKKLGTDSGSVQQSVPTKKSYNEVARDHLQVALIDELSQTNELSQKVVDFLLKDVEETGGLYPGFNSSESIRGCRVLKCIDEFSKEFLGNCVAELHDKWENLRLKLIPAKDIPRRPRMRIWLPKLKIESSKLLLTLQRQNPAIPMRDWTVLREEKTAEGTQSLSYLLLITEESLEPLRKAEKMLFGVRTAKIKIFTDISTEEDEVELADKLLEGMSVSEA